MIARNSSPALPMRPLVRRVERAHPDYPPSLLALPRPPPEVWLEGSMPARRCVAIVGTRRANAAALSFTERIARELATAGLAIVSGGARGIDAAAHRGALEGGGATIVVQAGGLDALYPRQHRSLFERAVHEGGLLLSEVPPGTAPVESRFLSRNRLIAALSEAVIVVQAPIKSGAMSTARWATRLHKLLFAVPHSPWDARGEGCVTLLAGGARVCRSSADVAAALGLKVERARARAEGPSDPDEMAVLAALDATARHVDELIEATSLGPSRVLLALTRLSLAGLASSSSPSQWRKV